MTQVGEDVTLEGLPAAMPTELFPVIRVECAGKPEGGHWAKHRVWGGDSSGFVEWARKRGTSVWRDGKERAVGEEPNGEDRTGGKSR